MNTNPQTSVRVSPVTGRVIGPMIAPSLQGDRDVTTPLALEIGCLAGAMPVAPFATLDKLEELGLAHLLRSPANRDSRAATNHGPHP